VGVLGAECKHFRSDPALNRNKAASVFHSQRNRRMIWCPRPDGFVCEFVDGLSTMIAASKRSVIEPATTTRASPLATRPLAEKRRKQIRRNQ